MPANKDWKRLVRARMQKTGESYTAARAALLKKTPPRRTRATANGTATKAAAVAPAAAPAKRTSRAAAARAKAAEYEALAGVADATIEARTGCGWERWVTTLDHHGAHAWTHTAIARFVHETFGISGWWSQSVTVGYERIKGLRAIGQRRGGAFEANKSRTFAVPLSRLFAAWHVAGERRRWLDVEPTVRTAQRDRSLRMTWPDGTSVLAWFTQKGAAKSTVAVTHGKLADAAALQQAKAYWAERLDALAAALSR